MSKETKKVRKRILELRAETARLDERLDELAAERPLPLRAYNELDRIDQELALLQRLYPKLKEWNA